MNMNIPSNQVHQIWVLEKLLSSFLLVDPAAPSSYSSVEDLRKVILSEENGMYECYADLFALRNNEGEEAISVIIESLGSKSVLLRYEVGYGSKSTNNVEVMIVMVMQGGGGGQR
ncbi:hypothetical protein T459_14484 [Capsicum annuum]|uniref:Uncharacterized protein n=1 Tax=Capsicum annuum TaxID=4072 RepID=A0A2G2ZHJ1_CAPAN|nr:hypothetical protein T459_14484 [Capsicum annuum]